MEEPSLETLLPFEDVQYLTLMPLFMRPGSCFWASICLQLIKDRVSGAGIARRALPPLGTGLVSGGCTRLRKVAVVVPHK